MLTDFRAVIDREELVKYGEYFRLQSKFLREMWRVSNNSRKEMYEAKKKRNGASPQTREVIRTRGRKKIDKQPTIIDDLPPAVSVSIDEFATETSSKKQSKKKRKEGDYG
jgi:hypothetical protein